MNRAIDSTAALNALWDCTALPRTALDYATLQGADPVVPSSFAVGTAAQTTIAAAALAACEFAHLRGAARQQVSVDMRHAALECVGDFKTDGKAPPLWEKFSGLYQCVDGWVRVHANFEHHRDGALNILGLNPNQSERADAERAMLQWRALDFENAAAEAGLVATAARTFAEWDQSLQGIAVASQPLLTVERIGDAAPLSLSTLSDEMRPLTGVRALDLTRVLAGPVAGRTLAAYGADVMLINAPHLPNISAIAETSRGKLSTHVDLRTAEGREMMAALLRDAHVFMQGYRPGGIESLGFGAIDAARLRPGIVYVSLCAYGRKGPWSLRRGFDSPTQTAMGFNHAEREAAGDRKPRPLPMQILDLATGYLIAMSVSATLARQQREGGSWHINVSLAQTAQWLRGLGRVSNGFAVSMPDAMPYMETTPSGFGELTAMRHAAQLSRTPAVWTRASMPPGSHVARWPSA